MQEFSSFLFLQNLCLEIYRKINLTFLVNMAMHVLGTVFAAVDY